MAGAGPTPPPGWYPDPGAPGQMRFWDGANWAAQAPAAQGWAPAQPQRGGLVTSVWSPRPGENPDDALARAFASYERTSGYVWIAVGIIQVVLLITIIAGAWNIYVGISRGKLASRIERRDPYIPAAVEPLTGYIVSGVLNLLLGGVLGVAMVGADLYVRDQILHNRQLFNGAPGPLPGSAFPGYAPGPLPSPPSPGYAPGPAPYPPAPPAASGPDYPSTW